MLLIGPGGIEIFCTDRNILHYICLLIGPGGIEICKKDAEIVEIPSF